MANKRTTQIFGEQKKNDFIYYSIMTILIILFTMFIILSNYKNNIYNFQFYKEEYKQNHVYQQLNSTLNETAVDGITINLFYYLNGNTNSLNSTFFSERDQLHLKDVKSLIKTSKIVYTIIVILIFILFIILGYKNKHNFRKAMAIVFIVSSLLCLLLICIAYSERNNFKSDFITFHEQVFNNDYWQLDPAKDNLVNLYPQQFWYDITAKILKDSAIYAILFLIIGCNLLLFGYLKKRYYKPQQSN